VAGADE
jgi:hypothetical protein